MNAMLNALRRMFRPAPRPAAPRGARLHLEALEERCVPSMTQITGAPTYPASAIVAVVSVFPDGQKIDGTGAMVDPDHVLTAGTMIYDPAYGGWATQIAVFAGTTSSTSYGPSAETKLARVEPAFYDTMNYRDGDIGEAGAGIGDFGLLTLNTNIGYLTGSFDLGSTDGSLAAGTSLNTIGYPEPLTDGWEMFQQYGPIASVSGGHYEQYAPQYGAPFVGPGGVFEFAYLDFSQNNIQEEPAQTGSPLFTYNNGQPSYIYGVMSDANSTTGYAEQITGYVSNDLHSWMDADNLGTTGVSPSDSVTYAPGVLPTQTTLQASASGPVSYGQSVTFTAYVSAPDAPTPITGLVTFKDNGSVLGTVQLKATSSTQASASFSISTLGVGSHTITAVYSETGGVFQGSTSGPDTGTVAPAQSDTTLTASAAAANYGQPLTFTAEVSGAVSGAPTGTVTFYDSGKALGTVTLTQTSVGMSYAKLTTSARRGRPHHHRRL